MKKILAMVLSVAIIATIALTGTVAYLTNQDSKVNQANVGSVFVEQYEKIRDANNQLINFVDDKQVVPAVYGTVFARGNYKLESEEEISLPALTGNNSVKNYQDKIVYAKNTGTAPAYMRTIIGVPTGSYDATNNKGWLHLDFNNSTEWDTPTLTTEETGFEIGDKKYDLYVLNHKGTVAGETFTDANLLGFYIDKDVNNEKDDAGSIYYTFNGKSIGNISDLRIYVATQAVQSEGFGSITDAFAATYGNITADNHPWAPKVVEGDVEALVTALKKLEDTATSGEQTIELTANAVYDFSKVNNWTPISNANLEYTNATSMNVTVKGNGAIIKNLTAPLFGEIKVNSLTIEGLTIDGENKTTMTNAATSGNPADSYGAFVQYVDNYMNGDKATITLDKCHLKNTKFGEVGKYVGGLIGYASHNNIEIKNCSVENCEIKSRGTAGGLVGFRMNAITISNCKVSGTTITSSNTEDWRIGEIIGTVNGTGTASIKGCTSEENTLTQTVTDASKKPENTEANYRSYYGRNYITADSTPSLTINETTIAKTTY